MLDLLLLFWKKVNNEWKDENDDTASDGSVSDDDDDDSKGEGEEEDTFQQPLPAKKAKTVP